MLVQVLLALAWPTLCTACGGHGEPVCDSTTDGFHFPCQEFLVAQAGECIPCGDNGEPVCDSTGADFTFPCQEFLVARNGECIPCGDNGEPVCDSTTAFFFSPCQEELVIVSGGSYGTFCTPCGLDGQPVCDSTTWGFDYPCQEGTIAQAGECIFCGQEGSPVCDSTVVDFTFPCESGLVAQAGECYTCGGNEEPVCDSTGADFTFPCREFLEVSEEGSCVPPACGWDGTPVCDPPASPCLPGYAQPCPHTGLCQSCGTHDIQACNPCDEHEYDTPCRQGYSQPRPADGKCYRCGHNEQIQCRVEDEENFDAPCDPQLYPHTELGGVGMCYYCTRFCGAHSGCHTASACACRPGWSDLDGPGDGSDFNGCETEGCDNSCPPTAGSTCTTENAGSTRLWLDAIDDSSLTFASTFEDADLTPKVDTWGNELGGSGCGGDWVFQQPLGYPTWTQECINGHPAMQFAPEPANEYFGKAAGNDIDDLLKVESMTWHVVLKAHSVPTHPVEHTAICFDGFGADFDVALSSCGWHIQLGCGSCDEVCIAPWAADTDPHLLTLVSSGSSKALYVDGCLARQWSESTTGKMASVPIIGSCGSTGEEAWDGCIGEVMAFDTPLGEADRLANERYLAAKWDLQVPETCEAITDASGSQITPAVPTWGPCGSCAAVPVPPAPAVCGQDYTPCGGGGGTCNNDVSAMACRSFNQLSDFTVANVGGGGAVEYDFLAKLPFNAALMAVTTDPWDRLNDEASNVAFRYGQATEGCVFFDDAGTLTATALGPIPASASSDRHKCQKKFVSSCTDKTDLSPATPGLVEATNRVTLQHLVSNLDTNGNYGLFYHRVQANPVPGADLKWIAETACRVTIPLSFACTGSNCVEVQNIVCASFAGIGSQNFGVVTIECKVPPQFVISSSANPTTADGKFQVTNTPNGGGAGHFPDPSTQACGGGKCSITATSTSPIDADSFIAGNINIAADVQSLTMTGQPWSGTVNSFHDAAYNLTRASATAKTVSMPIGVNFYTNFDADPLDTIAKIAAKFTGAIDSVPFLASQKITLGEINSHTHGWFRIVAKVQAAEHWFLTRAVEEVQISTDGATFSAAPGGDDFYDESGCGAGDYSPTTTAITKGQAGGYHTAQGYPVAFIRCHDLMKDVKAGMTMRFSLSWSLASLPAPTSGKAQLLQDALEADPKAQSVEVAVTIQLGRAETSITGGAAGGAASGNNSLTYIIIAICVLFSALVCAAVIVAYMCMRNKAQEAAVAASPKRATLAAVYAISAPRKEAPMDV